MVFLRSRVWNSTFLEVNGLSKTSHCKQQSMHQLCIIHENPTDTHKTQKTLCFQTPSRLPEIIARTQCIVGNKVSANIIQILSCVPVTLPGVQVNELPGHCGECFSQPGFSSRKYRPQEPSYSGKIVQLGCIFVKYKKIAIVFPKFTLNSKMLYEYDSFY